MTNAEQIQKAWNGWHDDIDLDIIPMPNPSFIRGYLSGKEDALEGFDFDGMKANLEELIRLRGESVVLRLLLSESIELIEDWANGLELDYEDIDDSVRLLGQTRRALGMEEA